MTEPRYRRDLHYAECDTIWVDSFGHEWQYDLLTASCAYTTGDSGWYSPEWGRRKRRGAGHDTHLGPFKEKGEHMSTRYELKAQIEKLQDELAEAQRKLADSKPTLPREIGSVIKFKKFDYFWAAIKVHKPGVGNRWYVTQDGSRSARQGIAPMTDEEFLNWVYERNWDSIETMF